MALEYIIQRGDTLSEIAEEMNVDMAELAEANDIEDVNKIYADQKLVIPSKEVNEEKELRVIEEKVEQQRLDKKLPTNPSDVYLPNTYTIRKGDSFNQIAEEQGITSKKLKKLNPEIKDTNKIKAGQVLKMRAEDRRHVEPIPSFLDRMSNFFVSSAEASAPEQLPTKKEKTSSSLLASPKKEASSTLIPSPVKIVFSSFFNKGKGTTFTEEDIGEDVTDMISQVAKRGLAAGRKNASYEDYPDTERGLPAAALVGAAKYADGRPIPKNIRAEYGRMRNEVYPKNPVGLARFVSDVVTDPVVKAALTVGGFSIHGEKGNYNIKDVFNFNTANVSKDDWYAWVRNKLSNSGIMPMTEDEGVKVNLKIKGV